MKRPLLPRTKTMLRILAAIALALTTPIVLAQEKIQLENFHAQCIGCHGLPGYKTAFPSVYHVPKIAGQQPGYIISALKAYKSGERSHPSMRGIAASLSDDDMKKLAEYYGVPAK